ncbi:Holliday junction resolvase RecU [Paenibacillus sp. G2S3]|uniref:Holliday junction resolvase RecU n=1 Tax=Paenibacillus sp. G2S3 TaxID=3047872 RepID=UPI0024C14A27|nr:Holliday junction resolvase RecU [Paenibacillus sp. G2S3]WHY17113.1 Holliday junction resolvase RecU [Paenibacillus sp. G2S3]
MAVINKRATPVKVTKSKGSKVHAGYFEAQATVDYDGIYRERAVFFEAKSIQELDRFDLKNVADHQYEHLDMCHKFGSHYASS